MILLLPPSETKRDGGLESSALSLDGLAFPELTAARRTALSALSSVSRSVSASMTALGLGPTQRAEIDRNRAVRSSPVMPALDRYTGVLFDGLGVETLSVAEREFAGRTLVMHSALFGLIRAGDGIPAYRLSHNSKLPGASLRALWRSQISAVLAARSDLVIDLRSESYVSLGPAPSANYVRVVSEGPTGTRVALSHFNKKGKGEFARAVVASGIEHGTVDSLLDWARSSGIRLDRAEHGGLDLVV